MLSYFQLVANFRFQPFSQNSGYVYVPSNTIRIASITVSKPSIKIVNASGHW